MRPLSFSRRFQLRFADPLPSRCAILGDPRGKIKKEMNPLPPIYKIRQKIRVPCLSHGGDEE